MVAADKTDTQEDYVTHAAQLVRNAREQKGLGLDQAEKDLHIPVAQLEALEAGDLSAFSAEVYTRGAYTQYAEYLGIDSKTAQRAILRALSSVRVITPLKMHTPETWWQRIQSPRLVIFAIGIFGALLVGGYIFWQLRLFWQLPALRITDPVEHVVETDYVDIEGVSERGARLSVNGEPFLLQEDNTFGLRIDLHYGINIIRFEATNAAGRSRVVEEHYLRPRPKGYL